MLVVVDYLFSIRTSGESSMVKGFSDRIIALIKSQRLIEEDETWNSFLEFEIIDKSSVNQLIERRFSKLYLEYVQEKIYRSQFNSITKDYEDYIRKIFGCGFSVLLLTFRG